MKMYLLLKLVIFQLVSLPGCTLTYCSFEPVHNNFTESPGLTMMRSPTFSHFQWGVPYAFSSNWFRFIWKTNQKRGSSALLGFSLFFGHLTGGWGFLGAVSSTKISKAAPYCHQTPQTGCFCLTPLLLPAS